jgi:hypothetical protein
MSKLPRRRSLALSAILSTSLIPALGLVTPSANAVNAGPADSALTISDGSSTVVVGGHATKFPTTVTDATWAPNGSRLAYVDAAGDLVSSLPDGSGVRVLAHGGPGIVISHPTWDGNGGRVVFAESVNGHLGPLKEARADGYGTTTSGGDGTVISTTQHTDDGGAYSAPDTVYVPQGSTGSHLIQDNLVFQEGSGSTAQIFGMNIYDSENGHNHLIATGSQPTSSPDGKQVAFVNADGQIALATLALPTPTITVLTHDSLHKQHPTFSPDGTKIAYEAFTPGTGSSPDVAKDVESVPATGGSPTVVGDKPGVPAYRPTAVSHVTRLAGSDRIGTAIAVSQAEFPKGPSADLPPTGVVLARSDQYADALSGSALAGDAPMLLTPPSALDPAVKAEIQRVLGPVNTKNPQTVTLLGGTQALSPAVESAVRSLGYKVQRYQGADRYATSVAIAQALTTYRPGNNPPQGVMVATGDNFADALSAGAQGYPIVLTDDKKMPAVTAAYLKSIATPPQGQITPTVYEVGGQAKAAVGTLWPTAAGRPPVIALAGADRFETSFLVAREFFGAGTYEQPAHIYVGLSTAYNWPDSLSGGTLMSNLGGPILLVDPKTGLTPQEKGWVSANSGTIDSALVFGGPVALSPAIDGQVGDTLAGPAGFVTATNPPSIPQ